ncbi:MAG: hypothetical protein BWZ07_02497 [Alphaproteobacteria bacterium ADurb.BinA280]|nr:MAG: hypothetical protein BWZ07_02497 [Alphaproteobacteria bacterium ADurb.BinA280]
MRQNLPTDRTVAAFIQTNVDDKLRDIARIQFGEGPVNERRPIEVGVPERKRWQRHEGSIACNSELPRFTLSRDAFVSQCRRTSCKCRGRDRYLVALTGRPAD